MWVDGWVCRVLLVGMESVGGCGGVEILRGIFRVQTRKRPDRSRGVIDGL
jgi:hypothetical protein